MLGLKQYVSAEFSTALTDARRELALLLIRTEFLCREVRQTLHKRCFQLVFREVQTLPRRIPSHTHAAIGV
jgi:hypothetical protein